MTWPNQSIEQTIPGIDFKINNSLNISLFDKSEESMVNDYESIQLGKDGGEDVKSYFEEIINSFITSNPVSVNSTINRIWDELIKEKKLFGVQSKNNFYHISTLSIYENLKKKF